jgi:hypothetical protein
MALVGCQILTIGSVDRDTFGDERGADIIKGREGIGGAERDFGPTGQQRLQENSGFGCDVQRGSYARGLKGLICGEFLPNLLQDGHMARGPGNAFLATLGEREIFNIVRHVRLPFSVKSVIWTITRYSFRYAPATGGVACLPPRRASSDAPPVERL